MSGQRLRTARFRPTILVGLLLMIFAPAQPAPAAVVNFQELLPFVDIKIPGWTMAGKPGGATLQQGKVMISEARASFKAGDQTLEIVIMDFWGRPLPFLLAQPPEMDCSEEIVRTTAVQGFKALETYRVRDKQGELSISVADRFWVKLDGEDIDGLAVLEKAAQHLDLKKLATLAK